MKEIALGRELSAREPVVYIYRWGKYRPEFKNRGCHVLARGALNTAQVRWLDNQASDVVSRNALKRAK